MFRRRSAALVISALLSVAGLSTAGAQTPPDSAPPDAGVLVARIEGRGHGHGVGLSQWGAHTMAQQGSSAAEILSTFYPGTGLGSSGGEVAVGVDQRGVVQISFPGGGEIRSGRDGSAAVPGFPVEVAAGAVATIRRTEGGYEVSGGGVAPLTASSAVRASQGECNLGPLCPSTTTTTAPPQSTTTTTTPDDGATTTTVTPGGGGGVPTSPTPVWAVPHDGGTVTSVDRGRTYRGLLQVSGALTVTNHLDVEAYLRGMIEVPGHWPPAAVQAQTIAARTFALRAVASGGSICDTDACQVYLGVARESPGLDAAVDATRGTVVTYNGGLAATFYSASAGGISASPQEGFGNDSAVPYLQPVSHPDANPQPWSVDVALDDLGRRFGYRGTITDVRIDETGPSGRAVAMSIDGDAGVVSIDPQQFRTKLGLRSTLYTVTVTSVDGAPAAPDESDLSSAVVGIDETGITSGVQAPVSGEPIAFAVAAVGPAGPTAWPWVMAIGGVLGAATFVGLATTGRWRRVRPWTSRRIRRTMGWASRRAGTMSGWLRRS